MAANVLIATNAKPFQEKTMWEHCFLLSVRNGILIEIRNASRLFFFLTAEKLFGGNVNTAMNGSEVFMIELMEVRVHTVTKNYLLLVNLILVHYIPI